MLDNSENNPVESEEIEISFGGFEDAITTGTGDDNLNDELAVDENDPIEDPISEDSSSEKDNEEEVNDEVDSPEANTEDSNESEETEDSEPTLVSEIVEGLGFEGLNPEDYEDSAEGIKQLTMDVARTQAGNTLDAIFNNYPTVKQHMEYLQNGGNPREFARAFSPPVDFASIKIKEDDVDSQRFVVSKLLKAKGNDDDTINDIIESYEDKGVLFNKSEIAKEQLAGAQNEQKQRVLQAQAQERQEAERIAQENWRGVQNTIKEAKSLAGLKVTEKDKLDFESYISRPVNAEGHTQRDIDASKLSLEQQLALDMLIMKGVDLTKFAATKGKTKETASLRDRLKSKEVKAKSTSKARRPISESAGDIKLDAIF